MTSSISKFTGLLTGFFLNPKKSLPQKTQNPKANGCAKVPPVLPIPTFNANPSPSPSLQTRSISPITKQDSIQLPSCLTKDISEIVMRYLLEETLDERIISLEETLSQKLGKPKASALAPKLCIYIEAHKNEWNDRVRKSGENIFIPASVDLPRSVQFNTDGTIFIHFTKSTKEGDPLLGEGTFKKVKLSLNYHSFKWYASSGLIKQRDQGVAGLLAVQGLQAVLQLRYRVNYTNKKNQFKTRIITDLFASGTLQKGIFDGSYSLKSKLKIATQIILGLTQIHEKGLLHRDFKPANIFVDSYACIGDLDTVCHYSDLISRSRYTTTCWVISPELAIDVLNNKSLDSNTNHKLDIWSLGCVLYDLMNCPKGQYTILPWASSERETLENLAKLATATSPWLPEPRKKNSLQHLIWQMLRMNPAERISSMNEVSKQFLQCAEIVQHFSPKK